MKDCQRLEVVPFAALLLLLRNVLLFVFTDATLYDFR
jgi:hypothetical protein